MTGPSTARPKSVDPAIAGLIDIVDALRDLPDARFRARLGAEFRTSAAIRTITPFISIPDGAGLIEFLEKTFDAEETARNPHGPGGFVASVNIGDTLLLIAGGEDLGGQERPASLHVFVNDCDATYRRALAAGAFVFPPGAGGLADRPWGERSVFVKDPFGNHWHIGAREGTGHVTPCLIPSKSPP